MTNYRSLSINVKKDCVTCRLGSEDEYPSPIINTEDADDPGKLETNIRVELKTAQVFHRVLNFIRSDDKLFEIDDFELLGEIIHKILFGKRKNDVRNLIVKNMITELSDKETVYRIFLDCNHETDFSMMSLPWEYIKFRYTVESGPRKGETTSCFMAADLQSRFHFIRRIGEEKKYRLPSPPADTLNIAVLFCGQENENASPVIHERLKEKKPVEEMFERLKKNSKGRLNYKMITDPEKSNFYDTILEAYNGMTAGRDPDSSAFVLHYVGHSLLKDQRGKLVMKYPDGLVNWVDDTEFTQPFRKSNKRRQPNLVAFQSCDSAKTGVSGARLTGVAVAMTDETVGIESVIGMQNEIDTATSISFFEKFYKSLLEGNDVGYAVTAGRHALGQPGGNMSYRDNSFGSPVLFITTQEPVALLKKEQADDSKDEMISCSWCHEQVNKKEAPGSGNFCQACGKRNPALLGGRKEISHEPLPDRTDVEVSNSRAAELKHSPGIYQTSTSPTANNAQSINQQTDERADAGKLKGAKNTHERQ